MARRGGKVDSGLKYILEMLLLTLKILKKTLNPVIKSQWEVWHRSR